MPHLSFAETFEALAFYPLDKIHSVSWMNEASIYMTRGE
jgi:hypothetical protein